MNIYEISTHEGAEPRFRKNRTGVREVLRTVPRDHRYQVRVYLRKVPNDLNAIVDLYNGIRAQGQLLRSFRLSLRGALVELAAGEE